jgi:cytoskeleton protein RodZ
VATDRPEFELSAPSARQTVGEKLHAARINAGLSVDNVAKQLKLSPRQVAALEKDDVASLPTGPFLRGFVRNYARLVNVEPEPLLSQLGGLSDAEKPIVTAPPIRGELRESSEPRAVAKWLVPAVLLGALIAGVTWYELRRPKTPIARTQPPVAAPANEPAPIAPAPAATTVPGMPPALPEASGNAPTASPAAAIVANTAASAPAAPPAPATAVDPNKPVTLELSFAENSWTEIRDAAGNLLTSRNQPKGSTLTVAGQPPFRFAIGAAKSVTLKRDGTIVDVASRAGANDVAKFTLE